VVCLWWVCSDRCGCSDEDWDMHWAEREWVYEVFDTMHLQPWQRINHFRNGRELCRKDNLIKNVKRAKRTLEKEGR
jgi:tubulin polyglutamylase TTLL9